MEAIVLVEFKDKITGVRYKVGDSYIGATERINHLLSMNFVKIKEDKVECVKDNLTAKKKTKKK